MYFKGGLLKRCSVWMGNHNIEIGILKSTIFAAWKKTIGLIVIVSTMIRDFWPVRDHD